VNRLSPTASGLRHLRWAREILGTLEAHYEHDPRLATAGRDLVLAEAVKLRALVNELSAAVKAYRDFLERERTRLRGMLRVGAYLVKSARGEEEASEAEAIAAGMSDALAALEARDRAPRKRAVREAVTELSAGLAAMDARIGASLPQAFVDSLYPDLTADASRVADVEDEDDDASG
jgi:hypothetical protein